MENYRRVFGIAIAVFMFIVGGLAFYYHFHARSAKAPISAEEKQPPQVAEEAASKKEISVIPLPSLGESDEWLLKKLKDLSRNRKIAEWLKLNDLIRRIAAALDNIAEGTSPRAHLKFLTPDQSFTVVKKAQAVYLNAQSYRRYDLVADAFASLDAKGAVGVFREVQPLFQEAYRELGYPEKDVRETLVEAIKELLRAPLVKGEILVTQRVTTYQMVDEKLESLDDAQKDLLRMGPQNTRKIQNKLREMASALGVPENQLPESRVYSTGR